jgi:serine/threonine-protein kinase
MAQPQALQPGQQVGQYRIRRLVGSGGFGAVYEAEPARQPGQSVALKETQEASTLTAFQHELAVLRRLRHPNLPRYYEVFAEGGRGYLVMEFVAGQDLEAVLAKGIALHESLVLGYALQLCDVLVYLHQQQPAILHRDIKPANICITPEGLLKLVDFGLVKHSTQATQTALRGACTPAYAPLEQYGGADSTDVRSDIYSLGATLYHLLTGREPPTAVERIAASSDPLIWPHKVAPGISRSVSQAIVTALALRKDDRYPTSLHFQQALAGAYPSHQAQRQPATSPGTHQAAARPAPAPPTPRPVAPAPPAPRQTPTTSTRLVHNWFGWSLKTTIAWAMGLLLAGLVTLCGVIGIVVSDPRGANSTLWFLLLLSAVGLVLGGSLGRAQRNGLPFGADLTWWGRLTGLAWAVALPVAILAGTIARAFWGTVAGGAAAGLSIGLISGLVQALLVRRAGGQRALVWLLATGACWPLAGVLVALGQMQFAETAPIWVQIGSAVAVGVVANGALGVVAAWLFARS